MSDRERAKMAFIAAYEHLCRTHNMFVVMVDAVDQVAFAVTEAEGDELTDVIEQLRIEDLRYPDDERPGKYV